MAILQTSGLGKDYGAIRAVDALDLQVAEGAMFGLLGPNGAGKTTAISMICGVVTPSRGSATVAGHDIAREPFAARRALGLVPQELALYDEISARQNLAFFGSIYDLSGAALAERIAWALDVAGLDDRADDQVAGFSGGMKRRLNLAAGLLHKPRVLILDEPTVGVDPQSRNNIFETIRALNRDHRMTVIYTSHYMEEVQALCQQVAIMDGGRLIAQDAVSDLIAAHADSAVELEFDGDASAVEQALRATIAQPADRPDDAADKTDSAIAAITVTDNTARIPGSGRIGAVIAAVEATGATLRAVRTRDADLETVFLTLTGNRLRDG
ncbi:MAG: ABC transporter ATP-binding protein [Myxococcota bacterium]